MRVVSIMSAKAEATIETLYRIAEKAELVDGQIRIIPPTGLLPGRAAMQICQSLYQYELQPARGHAIPGSVAFIVDLPHRKSFCADAAFYTGDVGMGFLQGAPIFAAEV